MSTDPPIADIARRFDLGDPLGPPEYFPGKTHMCKVTTTKGSWRLEVQRGDPGLAGMQHALQALALWEAGSPTPRPVFADTAQAYVEIKFPSDLEDSSRWIGVNQWIEGTLFDPSARSTRLARGLGQALGRFHLATANVADWRLAPLPKPKDVERPWPRWADGLRAAQPDLALRIDQLTPALKEMDVASSVVFQGPTFAALTHRDIHPANIVWRPDDSVGIIDLEAGFAEVNTVFVDVLQAERKCFLDAGSEELDEDEATVFSRSSMRKVLSLHEGYLGEFDLPPARRQLIATAMHVQRADTLAWALANEVWKDNPRLLVAIIDNASAAERSITLHRTRDAEPQLLS